MGQTNYQLPDLPYDFSAIEPVISAKIMELHYTKHHKGYVTKLNEALEKYHEAEFKNNVADMIALQQAIKFNGGGHINHSIFWTILSPTAKTSSGPEGKLLEAIIKDFTSFDVFKKEFVQKTVAIQGSGWGWLGYNKSAKALEIATCANQDPLSTTGLIPIFGIDVWEHAYYLQYENRRPEYVEALVNKNLCWEEITNRYEKAIG